MHGQRSHRERVPNSHFSGSRQISTIFGSCFPQWFGISDHRVMVLEFSAKAAFNGTCPAIATPKARALNSKIPRHQRQYCKTLSKLTQQHKMQRKLDVLTQIGPNLRHRHFQYLHNKYDSELGDAKCRTALHQTIHHSTGVQPNRRPMAQKTSSSQMDPTLARR